MAGMTVTRCAVFAMLLAAFACCVSPAAAGQSVFFQNDANRRDWQIQKYPQSKALSQETGMRGLPIIADGCVAEEELIYWGWQFNNLGYWQTCLANKTKHKYCVVNLAMKNYTKLDPTESMIVGSIGACVQNNPNCTDSNLSNMSTYMFDNYILPDLRPYLPAVPPGADFQVIVDCEPFAKPPVNGLTKFVMVLLALLASFLVLGTLIDVWEQRQSEERALLIQHGEEVKHGGTGGHGGSRVHYSFPVRVVTNFLRAFSAVHNFQRLLVPVPGATANLNGMRTLSMAWIIMGHTMYVALEVMGFLNHADFVKIVSSWDYMFVVPAVYAVDSFFWLSGFLVTFILVKQLRKMQARARDGAPMSGARKAAFWFMFYFHRYYRLTPVYFVIILVWWRLVAQMSDGPVWFRIGSVQTQCDQYWWANILYINNFVPASMLNECMSWSWYLANDFQFYVITPIICMVWIKNGKLGTLLVIAMLIGSYVATILLSYHDIVNKSTDFFTGQPYNSYVKPYVRIPPYLYGLLSAFFLHWVAPNGVEDFRQANFESGSVADKVQRFLTCGVRRRIVYFFAMALMVSGMFVDWYEIKEHNAGKVWSDGWLTTQCTYMRFCWGVGLSLVFVPWILGWGGLANRFLSHDFWTAGARLTYTAYLLHPLIMTVYFGSRSNGIEFSRQWLLFNFLGFLVAAYGLAGVFYLIVEKPMMNLEKYILPSSH